MPNITRSLLSLALAFGLAPAATALTIDNFEAGPFSLFDDTNSPAFVEGEQSGLATTDVVGGSRMVRVLANGTPGLSAQANLNPTAADDAAILTAQSTGNFTFFYDGSANGVANGINGSLNLDLSGFGSIDLEMVVVDTLAPVIHISLWDSSGIQVITAGTAITGLNSLALSGFTNIDLSDIRQIRILLQNVGVSTAISNISVTPVPEPGTGLLLSLGLLALAARRRRA